MAVQPPHKYTWSPLQLLELVFYTKWTTSPGTRPPHISRATSSVWDTEKKCTPDPHLHLSIVQAHPGSPSVLLKIGMIRYYEMGQNLLLFLHTLLVILKSQRCPRWQISYQLPVDPYSSLLQHQFLPILFRLVCSNGHGIEACKSPLQKPGTK